MQTPTRPVNFAWAHAKKADVAKALAVGLGALQRTVEAADPVAGESVETVQVPLDQPVDDEIADGCGHVLSPVCLLGRLVVAGSGRTG